MCRDKATWTSRTVHIIIPSWGKVTANYTVESYYTFNTLLFTSCLFLLFSTTVVLDLI